MRIALLSLFLCLAACKSGQNQSNDAVRQGVLDYLQKGGYNVSGMDIRIANVQFKDNQAEAQVNIGVKGSGTTAMSMGYHLELKDNHWTVVGKSDSGQHGALAPPSAGAENPHAGGAPGAAPGGGSGKMPSPDDLPPAGKKK
ncbi:MAG TPA: hypothetical protein VKE70_35500 [Candidatus Solibacter sp.]|nr:hypothetical protein [Candidatus Solibacter sp.]